MQDIQLGHGVGVIDPHGDLFDRLLLRLASLQDVWQRVVIIDPINPKWVVGFNPLAAIRDLSQERLSLFLTDIVVKIWQLEMANSPRLIWLLSNTFLALKNLNLGLLDLPRFLLDRSYREALIPGLTNKQVRLFFESQFPTTAGGINQWVTPLLNKLGGLLFDPDLRLLFSRSASLNFRDLLDKRAILLINIPKGILGEASSALIGAFIVAHLQKAALSRASTLVRTPFYLYLDEFQNYTTDNIIDILSESRKYAISLTLAHQYLDQLSPSMRSAVLNTSGNLVSFRVGYGDGSVMAKELFPSPEFITKIDRRLTFRRPWGVPFLTMRNQEKGLGWDGLAQIIARLPHRQFWYRKRGSTAPSQHRSLDMPDPRVTHSLKNQRNALIDYSGHQFGLLRTVARQEERAHPRRKIDNDTFNHDGKYSFWAE